MWLSTRDTCSQIYFVPFSYMGHSFLQFWGWYFLSKLSVVSGKPCFSLVRRKSIGCILLWQLGHLTWVLLHLMATFRECLFQLFIFQVFCQFKLQKTKREPTFYWMCTHNMESTLSNTSPRRYFNLIKKHTDIYWAPNTVWKWCKNAVTLTVDSWIGNNNTYIRITIMWITF